MKSDDVEMISKESDFTLGLPPILLHFHVFICVVVQRLKMILFFCLSLKVLVRRRRCRRQCG